MRERPVTGGAPLLRCESTRESSAGVKIPAAIPYLSTVDADLAPSAEPSDRLATLADKPDGWGRELKLRNTLALDHTALNRERSDSRGDERSCFVAADSRRLEGACRRWQ